VVVVWWESSRLPVVGHAKSYNRHQWARHVRTGDLREYVKLIYGMLQKSRNSMKLVKLP
jgi:hypothetical protein